MKTLVADKTFTHFQLGTIDAGATFECEESTAKDLVKAKLASAVKETKATDDKK